MTTSILSVIQHEIIEVKHALANATSHEGVERRDDLQLLLKNLQEHRLRALVAGRKPARHDQPMRCDGDAATPTFNTPVTRRRYKIEQQGNTDTGTPCGSNYARVQIATSGYSSGAGAGSSSSSSSSIISSSSSRRGTPGGALRVGCKRALGVNTCVDSPPEKRGPTATELLRRVRRDIEVGDVVSVLLEVRLPLGGWSRQWVRGEVLQNVSKCISQTGTV